jgi:predicted extracellular nuclease
VLLTFCGVANAAIVLNEVLGSTESTDTEYIELYNSGPESVDIGGWSVEFWESESGSGFGTSNGGPYTVPADTTLADRQHFLFANPETESLFTDAAGNPVMGDAQLPPNAIQNSSYTVVLKDAEQNVINTVFVTSGGSDDAANIAGELIAPDFSIGPAGTFLPAGFTRTVAGGDTLAMLEFSPRPAPSGTPTNSGGTVVPPDDAQLVSIMDIQGAGHTSPLLDSAVQTSGVVTAVASRGFYVQDPVGDGDIATSDALFVFTNSAPAVAVGDTVELAGSVSEFFPGGEDRRNLSTTQMAFPQITVSGTSALPAPVILGSADRPAPAENIDDDAFSSFDPTTDGIDYFESLEAMLVTIPSPLAIAPTSRFGEIFTVADAGVNASGISMRQTLNISPADFNPEKIQIDEDSALLPDFEFPDVNTGATLSDVTGVVSYDFGNFQVHATAGYSVTASAITPETSTIGGDSDRLTVASYNVLNLDANDDDGDTDVGSGRFSAIANHIVNNLNAPDIIGLQEIQDNDGSVESDTTAANVTLQTLTDAILAAGGPDYVFADTPGLVPGSVGGQPGGNIRVAFLYNPTRVELAGPATPLVDPADQAVNVMNPFFGSRISLAAQFEFAGETITVINNHLSSKGGSAPILGVEQPFDARQEDVDVNGSLDERQLQAAAVDAYVSGLFANDAEANVLVLGDMNEFEFVSPVQDLLGQNLTNTTDSVEENERYSFIFQGNSQQLDHILLSASLAETFELDIVHVNAEFAENTSRASDHDPLLISVSLGGGTTMKAGDLDSNGIIDRADYRIFVRALYSREGRRRYNPAADFDENGRINRRDLNHFLELYRVELLDAIPGDIDRDGDIDRRDARKFRRSLGSRAGQRRYHPEADLDNNNRINRRDWRLFEDLYSDYH